MPCAPSRMCTQLGIVFSGREGQPLLLLPGRGRGTAVLHPGGRVLLGGAGAVTERVIDKLHRAGGSLLVLAVLGCA